MPWRLRHRSNFADCAGRQFAEGAWVIALLIRSLMLLTGAVKLQYQPFARELAIDRPMQVDNLAETPVVVPLDRWTMISEKALRFAMKLTDAVDVVHVDAEDFSHEVRESWGKNVQRPLEASGKPVPELRFVSSLYRFVLMPLIQHILDVERSHPERQIAVLVPKLVIRHFWEAPLHNQRSQLLKLLLLIRGNQCLIVINIPWYLQVCRHS